MRSETTFSIAVLPATATYVIPASTATRTFDGSDRTSGADGQPWSAYGPDRTPAAGDIIELAAGTHGSLRFDRLEGAPNNRITIRNASNGQTIIRRESGFETDFVLRFRLCRHVNVDGTYGGQQHGIKVMYAASGVDAPSAFIMITDASGGAAPTSFMTFRGVEVDGGWLAGYSTDGVGIQLNDHANFKWLDDDIYPTYWREGFLFDACWVHDVEGEGMYIGPNWHEASVVDNIAYDGDAPLRNVEIRNCLVEDTGWDGIQGKCWLEGAGENKIHGNTVKRYGRRGDASTGQHYGIACSGFCDHYDNFVADGGEHCISTYVFQGPPKYLAGDNHRFGPFVSNIFNNVCVRAGSHTAAGQLGGSGIVCGSGASTNGDLVEVSEPYIYNNTIVDSLTDAINVNSNTPSGIITNNMLVGNTTIVRYNAVTATNNATSGSFVDGAGDNYRLTAATSPLAQGSYVSSADHDGVPRVQADCGAFEFAG